MYFHATFDIESLMSQALCRAYVVLSLVLPGAANDEGISGNLESGNFLEINGVEIIRDL